MRRALATALLALVPAAAHAQQTPPTAQVVAGPLASGATLVAFDHGTQLCLDVRHKGEDDSYAHCAPVPDDPRQAQVEEEFGPTPTWHFAAVPADVATVEVVLRNGRVIRAATQPGDAYTGRAAGKVRFFLAESPGNDEPVLTRLLDASGRVVSARANPEADFFQAPPPGARRIARGGGAQRWAAYVFARRRFDPTPLPQIHATRQTCVALFVGREPGARGQTCVSAPFGLQGRAMGVAPQSDCFGTAVVGLAAPRVARVVLVLADGRRVALPLHAAPSGLRAFATLVAADAGIRRLVAYRASGAGIADHELRLAPADAPCLPARPGSNFGFAAFEVSAAGTRRPPLAPGAPVIVVRDVAGELCVAPGGLRPFGRDCALPSTEPYDARLIGARGPGRTVIAGVVPLEDRSLALVLDGGRKLTVRARLDVGYHGAYAGLVRFVAAVLPAGAHVLRARLEGPGPAFPAFVEGLDPQPSPPRTIARRGEARLAVSRIPGYPHATTCVALGTPQFCLNSYGASLTAHCGPFGGIAVAGLLGRGMRAVVAELADGTRVRADVLRAPAGFPARPRAWLIALRPGQGLRRLVATGSAGKRAAQALPPATRQCGYDSLVAWDTPAVFG
jgi:hypothetical protein